MEGIDRGTIRIIELLARGLTTGEVADRLAVDPELVRERVRRAMLSTGARSKLELVILAIHEGLIRV